MSIEKVTQSSVFEHIYRPFLFRPFSISRGGRGEGGGSNWDSLLEEEEKK